MVDGLSAYYRTIQGYHDLIEHQDREGFVVPTDLLLRFIDGNGLVVDIGGGSGINAEILGLEPGKYVCADISFAGLEIAREKGRGSSVQSDVNQLPMRDNSVDIVLCSWAFEHFTRPDVVLQEMTRILKRGGRAVIWGPNWDNIFRKDFPQFAHRSRKYVRRVRWKIFLKMIRNEFLPFQYNPYIALDVAALANPRRYIACDTDAVHCALCQETFLWFRQNGLNVLHIADFSEMGAYLYNGRTIRFIRTILRPLLPMLRHIPLVRWFVMRFPIAVEKPR